MESGMIEVLLEELEEGPKELTELASRCSVASDRMQALIRRLEDTGAVEKRSVAGKEVIMLRSRVAVPEDVSQETRPQDEDTREDIRVSSNITGVIDDFDQSVSQETGKSPNGESPRTIGIVSGKGGVGKTVVTANLGAALEDLGEPVIAMDADAEMSNLALQLGMHSFPAPLEKVLEEGTHIMSAIQIDPESGLKVIPTSLAAEPLPENINDVFSMLPSNYTVLIDAPPGFERPLERVVETSDELLFVTTPEKTSVTDTYKLAREAEERGKNILGVIVNMYSSDSDHLSLEEVEEMVDQPIIEVIDHSNKVRRSILNEKPVVAHSPYSNPSRQFKRLAATVSGKDYEETLLDRIRGFLQ